MFNRPRHSDVTIPIWPPVDTGDDHSGDGPIALLRGLLSLAGRYKVAVLLCMASGVAIAYVYAQALPPVYNATATLLLEPRRAATSVGEMDGQQVLDLNRADGELQTIRSERLLSYVFDSLGLRNNEELGPQPPSLADRIRDLLTSIVGPVSVSAVVRENRIPVNPNPLLTENDDIAAFLQFTNRLTARRVGQSFVLEIEYSSSDPDLPARVANATASAYIFQVIAFKEQIARASSEALQGRLDSLSRQVDAARLAMQSGTLPSIPTPDADARVIGAALPPLGPSAPRKSLIVAFGGVIGLIGGFSLVALRLALDRRVKDGKELSRELRLPCFGILPKAPVRKNTSYDNTDDTRQRFLTSIRDIRTSIDVACSGITAPRSTVIAIASFMPTPGVPTICAALAELIERTDKKVTVFSSEGSPSEGVSNDKMGEMALADAPFISHDIELLYDNTPGMKIVPIHSSNSEANLFTDFNHPQIGNLIEIARRRGDVLLALPALGLSMDGLALAGYADAIIIVADGKRTTIDEVSETATLLRRTSPVVIGTVIYR